MGDATATVNVKRFGYSIAPDGVTISGGTTLTLHLDRNDGVPLADNDAYEHKVVWRTTGSYGKFNGALNRVTQERNGNYNIDYDALDETVRMGTETVTALIYSKQISDSHYALVDEISATINIDNDPKKKYLVLTPIYTVTKIADEECIISSNPIVTETGSRNTLNKSTYINAFPNAKSYRLDLKNVMDGNGRTYPDRTITWSPGSTQYINTTTNPDKPNPEVTGAAFRVSHASATSNTCNPQYGYFETLVSGTTLIAQLTVTLE